MTLFTHTALTVKKNGLLEAVGLRTFTHSECNGGLTPHTRIHVDHGYEITHAQLSVTSPLCHVDIMHAYAHIHIACYILYWSGLHQKKIVA